MDQQENGGQREDNNHTNGNEMPYFSVDENDIPPLAGQAESKPMSEEELQKDRNRSSIKFVIKNIVLVFVVTMIILFIFAFIFLQGIIRGSTSLFKGFIDFIQAH